MPPAIGSLCLASRRGAARPFALMGPLRWLPPDVRNGRLIAALRSAGVAFGAAAVLWRREFGELRQNWLMARELLQSVGAGIALFWIWIQLDAPWMQLEPAAVALCR